MKKIIVNFGKNIDIDYIKYESDDTYNYFICLDDYYMGSIKYIKIDKKFKKNITYIVRLKKQNILKKFNVNKKKMIFYGDKSI